MLEHFCNSALKNNETIEIYNGQTATIKAIDANRYAVIKLASNQEIQLNLKELSNQHWDYAYAATTFVAQGRDTITTIALAKGAYIQEILTKEIKVGDVLMINSTAMGNQDCATSKLVRVMNIHQDLTALAKDRDGTMMALDLKKSPMKAYCKDQAIWQCYPNPTTRKASNIPKLTSVEEFLVSVTRGDQVTLLVDHIESYQHALEHKLFNPRSALEFLDPKNQEVRAKVDRMTQNITGIATKMEHSKSNNCNNRDSLYQKSSMITIEEVIGKLHSNILQTTTNWLGTPQKTSSDEARWGKKGSLVVKLSGEKAGYWHDFEKSVGGKNLLSLYMERFNLDFKHAIQELSMNLRISSANKLFSKMLTTSTSKKSSKLPGFNLKKITYINKIYSIGEPINGTLAEKYLREFRGISGNIPEDFRFCAKLKHPDLQRLLPALIAPIRNEQGQIQGIVRIFLNKDGNKLNENYLNDRGLQQLATVKANLGNMLHSSVEINRVNSPHIYIAEGIETALSIAQAKPYDRVVAALSVSNLKNVPLPSNTKGVILCADYDGVNSLTNKALLAAADFYQAKGLQVAIAYPEKIPGLQKFDFNDVLKHLGISSIAKSLQNATSVTMHLSNNLKLTNNAMQLNATEKEHSL